MVKKSVCKIANCPNCKWLYTNRRSEGKIHNKNSTAAKTTTEQPWSTEMGFERLYIVRTHIHTHSPSKNFRVVMQSDDVRKKWCGVEGERKKSHHTFDRNGNLSRASNYTSHIFDLLLLSAKRTVTEKLLLHGLCSI